MKNGLDRATNVDGVYGKRYFNVYDIKIKTIVFTGDRQAVAKYIGIAEKNVNDYVNNKRVKSKQFTLRNKTEA